MNAMIQPKSDITNFVPNTGNTRLMRDAFGRFATGVTIITAQSADGPVAITANSFSSVSLTPPLVLWSSDKQSRRYEFFANVEHYAIHVLAHDQGDLCWRIAKDLHGLDDFGYVLNSENVPVLDYCLARFECERRATYAGGDHEIVLGEVLRAEMRHEGDALGFFKGQIGSFSET